MDRGGGGRLVCCCCLGCFRATVTGRCCCLCWPCLAVAAEEVGFFVAPLVLLLLAVLAVREAREAAGCGCNCKPAAVLKLERIFLNTAPIPPPDSIESLFALFGGGGGPLATACPRCCWFWFPPRCCCLPLCLPYDTIDTPTLTFPATYGSKLVMRSSLSRASSPSS